MTIYVRASSSFCDEDLFWEHVKKYQGERLHIDERLRDMCVKANMSFTVDDFLPKEDDTVIFFWDGESKRTKALIQIAQGITKDIEIVPFVNVSVSSFHQEVEKIHNDVWREGCKKMMENIPNYFWVVAASSSGKYHPQCSLGVGGLVRHSVMVSVIGADLLDNETFLENTEINQDKVRIACLFHDCMKQGMDGCEGHTVFEHPILAAEFIQEQLKDYIDEENLKDIVDAVKTHMGRWTTSKYSDKELEKPETAFQKLVHNADYFASRKYLGGIWEG